MIKSRENHHGVHSAEMKLNWFCACQDAQLWNFWISIIMMPLEKRNSYLLVFFTRLNSMSTRCFHYFVTKSCIFEGFWPKSVNFCDFPLKQYWGNTYFFYTFFTKLLNLWTSIYQSGIRYLLASKRLSLTHFYNHLCNFPAVKHFL